MIDSTLTVLADPPAKIFMATREAVFVSLAHAVDANGDTWVTAFHNEIAECVHRL